MFRLGIHSLAARAEGEQPRRMQSGREKDVKPCPVRIPAILLRLFTQVGAASPSAVLLRRLQRRRRPAALPRLRP